MIIYAKSQRAIWLFWKEYWSSPWQRGRPNSPYLEQLLYFFFTNSYSYAWWCVVSSVLIQCLVSVELSACLPASCLVVPFLATTQETHRGTYIANYIMGHDALKSYQVNRILYPQEDPFSLYKMSWRKSTRLLDVFN